MTKERASRGEVLKSSRMHEEFMVWARALKIKRSFATARDKKPKLDAKMDVSSL